jgi:hypothetical protein
MKTLVYKTIGEMKAAPSRSLRFPEGRTPADQLHLELCRLRVLPERHGIALSERRMDSGKRVPTNSSLYPFPDKGEEAALVILSDVFPTGLECEVLNGKLVPGWCIGGDQFSCTLHPC